MQFRSNGSFSTKLPLESKVSVAFVLVPGFSLHAFTAALEPLRLANKVTGQELYSWVISSDEGKAVKSSSAVEFSSLESAKDCCRADWLIVCSGENPKTNTPTNVPHLVREAWRMGATVGGLCTGAFALAEAGILSNAEFTLHWDDRDSFQNEFPHLISSEKLYCVDNRIVTSSGGASSTDLMLSLIARERGTELAAEILDLCLHGKMRESGEPSRSSISSIVGRRNGPLIKAIKMIEQNYDQEFTIAQIADAVGISRRHFERLFSDHLNTTPYRYLTEVRLEKARKMLLETDLSTLEVSIACGFQSPTNFARRFREKFGVRPSRYSSVSSS